MRRAAAAAGLLALAACVHGAAPRAPAADAVPHVEPDLVGVVHVVRRGETLYRIARTYGNEVVQGTDPRGRKYYWIGGAGAANEDIPHSDCNAVFKDGLASVTPLHLDWSHDALLGEMRSWTIEGYEKEPSL